MGGRILLADRDIRRPLHKWLRAAHADDPSTSILHEFKVPRPSARADIAVVNGEIVAYEIKSDVDSLARLSRQIPAFSKVFDKVSLVTTEKHVRSARAAIPHWWGITLVRQRYGELELAQSRKSKRNPSPELLSLLHALFVPELKFVLHSCAHSPPPSYQKHEIVSEIVRLGDGEAVRAAIRCILKQRYSAAGSSGEDAICL